MKLVDDDDDADKPAEEPPKKTPSIKQEPLNQTQQLTTQHIGTTARPKHGKHAKSLRLIQNPFLHFIARTLDVLIILGIILYILSYKNIGKYPDASQISPLLKHDPIQELVQEPRFSFDYRGHQIQIHPIANYDIYGLIVSQNDIDGFIYGYDEDDVNIRDICVIWGQNLDNNRYHDYEFYNKQWTCNIRLPREDTGKFNFSQLSNNHLLSDNKAIRNTIRNFRVGDQVHLTGQLVAYRTDDTLWRPSSTRRDDMGNGACEVMLVKSANVVKQGTPGWYKLYNFSEWLVMLAFIGRILVFAIGVFV